MIWCFFSYLVFFYSIVIMASYLWLTIQSWRMQNRLAVETPDDATIKYMIDRSPLAPSVSIIAPAHNEEVNIKTNVESLINIDYPNFEVIIVDDGSTDKTLEILEKEYDLEPIPFKPTYKVPCTTINTVYRTRRMDDEKAKRLVVVNKINGGRKADSSNAGINVCKTDYFICTDADCIVDPMALYRMMWPVFNSHETMIGVSGTMLISNDCDIPEIKARLEEKGGEKNWLEEAKEGARDFHGLYKIGYWVAVVFHLLFSWMNLLPKFQQLEYMRSFLIGKLGWSSMNTLPNISGGFGLFNTEVAIKSGGYDRKSMAEDVDMLLRMVTYMKNNSLDFRLAQVPKACCWTQGPVSLEGIFRQRKRWARGLFEIVTSHFEMFFNRHYGSIGSITLPYIFIFEFLAAMIEFGGLLWLFLWLIPTDGVNWHTFWVIMGMVWAFSLMMTFVLMYFDHRTEVAPWKRRWWRYMKFFICSAVEPFYHVLITCISVYGYIEFLSGTGNIWKSIDR